jgi:hypothetical protein
MSEVTFNAAGAFNLDIPTAGTKITSRGGHFSQVDAFPVLPVTTFITSDHKSVFF